MVLICCFQCEPRLATYIIAVLSGIHCGMEISLLLALDDKHRLVDEDDGVKFYTVLFTQIYLMISAILLFFSAYYLLKCLCIPWIIGSVFNVLIQWAILAIIFSRVFGGEFSIEELEKGLFICVTMMLSIYSTWIVLVFFWELLLSQGKDSDSDQASDKPVFTLYGDDDEDDDDDNEQQHRKNTRRQGKNRTRKGDEESLRLINH